MTPHILDEAIALFGNGNYSGQTVKKMLRELKEKKPAGVPPQYPHWLIGRVTGIDGDTNEYFCNAQSERSADDVHTPTNCPACGSQVFRHFWCIDPDCGWSSKREEEQYRKGGRE